jgi:hypothetical protein
MLPLQHHQQFLHCMQSFKTMSPLPEQFLCERHFHLYFLNWYLQPILRVYYVQQRYTTVSHALTDLLAPHAPLVLSLSLQHNANLVQMFMEQTAWHAISQGAFLVQAGILMMALKVIFLENSAHYPCVECSAIHAQCTSCSTWPDCETCSFGYALDFGLRTCFITQPTNPVFSAARFLDVKPVWMALFVQFAVLGTPRTRLPVLFW